MSRWAKDGEPTARRLTGVEKLETWLFIDELTEEQQADIRRRLYTGPNLRQNSGKTRHIAPKRRRRTSPREY